MAEPLSPTLLESLGLEPAQAVSLANAIDATGPELPAAERWRELTGSVLGRELPFAVHQAVHGHVFRDWPESAPPPPAWLPAADARRTTNPGRLLNELGLPDYTALHRWSVTEREAFWQVVIDKLEIVFETPPEAIAKITDVRMPEWLPGARLNIAETCFRHDPDTPAVIFQEPGGELQTISRGELEALSNRVANSLRAAGFAAGEAIGLAMPMNVEAVAIYLGIVKAGCVVVSISDSFSPAEIATRLRIAGATGIFTQELRTQTYKPEQLYTKVKAAGAPRAIVLPFRPGHPHDERRPSDLRWSEFLVADATFEAIPRPADATCNVLFSSGTTGDPKAIPWTHTTPIRAAGDGYLHHDIQPGDVVAWPTNLGWMMGPWLVFAALINGAALALYGGPPSGRGFGRFVEDAGVTMLGLVPSLVKSWRITRCVEGCDWSRIRAFSSTGECSNAEDMLYLMYLAGYRPVIEYCGGTEIGGGYITGTVLQPASPATFSTPALGHDFVILDEDGKEADVGELYLIPPSIGLSSTLLNHDHLAVYHDGVPAGPRGEVLRRHGDQMQRLPGGYYRSLGRADDTMNLKGVKVSSAELERSFNQVDGIKETAAIAVPPPGGGPSLLVVYVVPRPEAKLAPAATKAALQTAIRAQHSSLFKVSDVRIVDELPRTASNKIMRRQLRAGYQAEQTEAQ